jgi:folate-dependent phosphoribosylglycinamide formyltransferase PurN
MVAASARGTAAQHLTDSTETATITDAYRLGPVVVDVRDARIVKAAKDRLGPYSAAAAVEALVARFANIRTAANLV